MPKVSVIVPIYNAEKYLAQCINSLLVQNEASFELILVNDGSSDKSLDICLSCQEKDERVKVFSKENGGVSSARNLGISKACGYYLAFADADDFVEENYLEALLKRAENDVDMVVMGVKEYSEDGKTRMPSKRLQSRRYEAEELKRKLVDDGSMSGFLIYSPCSVLYKRNIIEEKGIRFREDIYYNEDGLFNTEYILACSGSIVCDTDCALYYYRKNNNSASRSVDYLGEKYGISEKNMSAVLRELSLRYPGYDIEAQAEKRTVTTALKKLMYIAKTGEAANTAKEILEDPVFVRALGRMDSSALSKKKKVCLGLLKTRRPSLIIAGLKFYELRKK